MKNKTVKSTHLKSYNKSSYSHKIVGDLVKEFQMAAFIFAGVTVQE